jgi:hypothetical protein
VPLLAEDGFGGVAFDVLVGRTRRAESKTAVHLIPGGDVVYEDRAGRGERLLTATLYLLDQAVLEALEALVGDQGTLLYHEGTYTATLLSLSAEDTYLDGSMTVRSEWRLA